MGKSYWINIGDSTEITNFVMAVNSEQAELLQSLGVTITNDTTYNMVEITADGRFLVRVKQGSDGIQGFIPNSTGVKCFDGINAPYINFLFTATSIMITANNVSKVPASSVSQVVVITKNNDGEVTIMGTGSSSTLGITKLAIVDRYDYSAPSYLPYIYKDTYASADNGNIDQFTLYNIPRSEAGQICDNAFIVPTRNSNIFSGLAVINGVEYAIAEQSYFRIACK